MPLPRDLPDPGYPPEKEAELNFGTPKSRVIDDPSTLDQLKDTYHGGCILMLMDSEATLLGMPLSSEAQGNDSQHLGWPATARWLLDDCQPVFH